MILKPAVTAGRFLKKFDLVKKKSLLVIILASIFLLLIMGGFFWWRINGDFVNSTSKEKIYFTVNKGDGLSKIALGLKEKGLINDTVYFRLIVYLSGYAGKLKAGGYYLSSLMSAGDIIQTLTKGSNDQWLTIVEGLRQEEIAQNLMKNGFVIDINKWNSEINTGELEGKLFPDSYLFPVNATQGAILSIINKNFKKKVEVGLHGEINKNSLNLNQVLILASIIEREARHDEDRAVVAGILLKRLENGWPLQVDAVLQYAVGTQKCQGKTECDWWPKNLGKQDLQFKSPFNTYLYKGLPPWPISNPGLSSIKAVLNPVQTDYWYYISDQAGNMHYAKTDVEHSKNINKYLR